MLRGYSVGTEPTHVADIAILYTALELSCAPSQNLHYGSYRNTNMVTARTVIGQVGQLVFLCPMLTEIVESKDNMKQGETMIVTITVGLRM